MLINVHVKNLALIDESEVYFKEGLNILTGETGAGKSIIIGSINLALGSKLSKDMVREGADYGLVELVFETDSNKVIDKLKDMEIPFEDNQIIISRKIVSGRSIIKVNGETVSATALRELAELLIDIYGQHDNQELMKKSKHLGILDRYGHDKIAGFLEAVQKDYKEYKDLRSKLKDFDMDEEERNKEISFLEFQIKEIEEANVRVGEDEELEEEYKKMTHSQKIVEALSSVYIAMGGEDSSFYEGLSHGIREISQVTDYDEKLKSFYDTLMDIDSICSDLSREVSSYMDEMSFDEERVNYVTQRLDVINKIKFKYGNNTEGVEAVNKTYKKLSERYELLINADTKLKELKTTITKAEEVLKKDSDELTKIRKNVAQSFEKELISQLKDLNFMDVNFKVQMEKTDSFSSVGNDDVEFYISTNPGEKIKPLADTASGGELSRIMLGLKAVMAGQDDIDTLIFDEIDTGISGKTAGRVAEKMKLISRHHQVMAITHLPQIAAMADNHFLIEKSVKNGKTVTDIEALSYEDSVNELARMLGGVEITDIVRKNAREMKEKCCN